MNWSGVPERRQEATLRVRANDRYWREAGVPDDRRRSLEFDPSRTFQTHAGVVVVASGTRWVPIGRLSVVLNGRHRHSL
jgi:hypothetical protein